jgi:hypothetical protein
LDFFFALSYARTGRLLGYFFGKFLAQGWRWQRAVALFGESPGGNQDMGDVRTRFRATWSVS